MAGIQTGHLDLMSLELASAAALTNVLTEAFAFNHPEQNQRGTPHFVGQEFDPGQPSLWSRVAPLRFKW